MYGDILSIGTERQLFVDDYIVEDTWCAPGVIHAPQRYADNPLLVGEQSWELNPGGPEVRQQDDGTWQMWYKGHISTPQQQRKSQYRIGYAVSEDGLHWEKPNLGLVEYDGSTENNMVIDTNHVNQDGQWIAMNRAGCNGPQGLNLVDGIGPANDDGLLHAVTKTGIPELIDEHPKGGVCHLISEDGVHWRRHPERYIMIYGHSDCLNHVVWNPQLERYLCYMRPPFFAGPAKRRMAVSQSPDMIHWTQPVVVVTQDERDPPARDFDHCRVFRYHGMWLCFLATYDHGPWANPMQLELIHSRDGLIWRRLPQRKPILECGPPGAFDSGLVASPTRPFEIDGQLRVYYTGSSQWRDNTDGSWRESRGIGLLTWRIDGFVSRRHEVANQARYIERPGEILTRPFRCDGERLLINAATSPHGHDGQVTVEVMQVDTTSGDHLRSSPVAPGFADDDCIPFTGDHTDHVVCWKKTHSLRALRGKVIRLKFYLSYAEIFAFQLAEEP